MEGTLVWTLTSKGLRYWTSGFDRGEKPDRPDDKTRQQKGFGKNAAIKKEARE
jgi:hypothetical protein